MFGLIADDGESHGEFGVQGVGLVEHADGHATATSDLATVGFPSTAQQAEQRRLAVTIATNDTDAIAFRNTDGDVVENYAGRKFEADALGAKKVGHESTAPLLDNPGAVHRAGRANDIVAGACQR